MKILTLGHPTLVQQAQMVRWPDARLAADIASLREALADFRREHGFGRAIAAPQLGISKRLIFVNLETFVGAIINPRISWRSDEMFSVWDDCLSVPDSLVKVRRHKSISVKFEDSHTCTQCWEYLTPDLSELLQHEVDHLDGILMTARAIDADSIVPIAMRAELIESPSRSVRSL